jgi:hypothetical protein
MISFYKQEPKIASSIPKSTPIAKDIIRVSFGRNLSPRVRGIIIANPIKMMIELINGINVLKTGDIPQMRL